MLRKIRRVHQAKVILRNSVNVGLRARPTPAGDEREEAKGQGHAGTVQCLTKKKRKNNGPGEKKKKDRTNRRKRPLQSRERNHPRGSCRSKNQSHRQQRFPCRLVNWGEEENGRKCGFGANTNEKITSRLPLAHKAGTREDRVSRGALNCGTLRAPKMEVEKPRLEETLDEDDEGHRGEPGSTKTKNARSALRARLPGASPQIHFKTEKRRRLRPRKREGKGEGGDNEFGPKGRSKNSLAWHQQNRGKIEAALGRHHKNSDAAGPQNRTRFQPPFEKRRKKGAKGKTVAAVEPRQSVAVTGADTRFVARIWD